MAAANQATDDVERKSTFREYYEALLIAFIFVNFARIFVFQAFKIPTGSMEDNLKVGDHIIVNKFIYGPAPAPLQKLVPLRDIRRGDIIVFRYPRGPETDYVKRVIGLPGDTVAIRDRTVWINGSPLEEPYVIHKDPKVFPASYTAIEQYRVRDQMPPFVVPENEYFAMGDNRDLSYDSRYWGTVPRSMIKGKAFMVYWSFCSHPPGIDAPMGERVRELASVAAHFFSRSRWDRTLFVVDSRYHYHDEPDCPAETAFSE
jgi:signal peptidase I